MRIVTYSTVADAVEENLGLPESTALQCLVRFFDIVIDMIEAEYLRSPKDADVERLIPLLGKRGFPVIIGSIECSE